MGNKLTLRVKIVEILRILMRNVEKGLIILQREDMMEDNPFLELKINTRGESRNKAKK